MVGDMLIAAVMGVGIIAFFLVYIARSFEDMEGFIAIPLKFLFIFMGLMTILIIPNLIDLGVDYELNANNITNATAVSKGVDIQKSVEGVHIGLVNLFYLFIAFIGLLIFYYTFDYWRKIRIQNR